jgi:HSP20 family protein
MADRLNRFFSRNEISRSNGSEMMTVADWVPSVDISETNEAFHIAAELPEVKKEDVKVTIENSALTLQGERKQEQEEMGRRKIHRTERSYGRFLRSFSLSEETVDDTNVTAEFNEGVLHITLPKRERAQPKAIEVKLAS